MVINRVDQELGKGCWALGRGVPECALSPTCCPWMGPALGQGPGQSWMGPVLGRGLGAPGAEEQEPPHAKSSNSLEKTDAGRDWGQEEKGTTEDEMAGWHHRLDGREFE